jgi:nucleoside-specific outer membrane channel protein Tsx
MENPMINMKTLSAVALVTAALSSPVFAQDEAAAPQKPVHALRHYRHAYNQVQGPSFVAPRENGTYLENESFDRSRIGDHDPDFNPPGN